MKVVQVISESRGGDRMEVIAEDEKNIRRTLHIHRHPPIGWMYCAGKDRNDKPVFEPIDTAGITI